ncbi:MAG TPA: ribosome biogenesis GTP-binding protein YihA/YsxC [Candidatus Rifleibacterium sp.]|nr:ribosome biogenesis GTP-binding protein YihA/YsxC [Candidatus Rifleibacterium sp.]
MTIKITAATFSACITSKEGLPADDLPVIALVGRSNVGKSSLINAITGRRELARTSSLPGKTLTINFYCINDAFYIVDLPGYGYAKASKVTKARIQAMMNEFFAECKNLKGVIQILDIRHRPSPLDIQMHEWVREQKFNHFAVLTKADKLSNQQALKMRSTIQQDIKGVFSLFFSAQTCNGRDDFLDAIEKVIAGLEFKTSDLKQKRFPRQDDRQPRNQSPRPDRQPKGERGPRPPRPERHDRPPRPDKPARPDRPDRPERPARTDNPAVQTEDNNGQAKSPVQAQPDAGQNSNPDKNRPEQPRRENEGGGQGNRRRRWKSRKPGNEPRQGNPNNPKTD